MRVTAQFMLMPVKQRLFFRIVADAILIGFNLGLAYLCTGLVAEAIEFGERSATLGVGTFEWSFDHLQELSGKLADDVVAQRAAAN